MELRRRRGSFRCGLMLSVTVQFIVAMLAYARGERMARKAAHLREKNRVLKEALCAATGKRRIAL